MKTVRVIIITSVMLIVCGLILSFWKTHDSPVAGVGFPLSQKWSFGTQNPVEAISASSNQMILVRSGSKLYALDSMSAKPKWVFNGLKKEVYLATAKAANGKVYITDKEYVYALDEFSGKVIWQQALQMDSGVKVIEIFDNYVLVNRPSKDIIALNAETGNMVWSVPASRGSTQIHFDKQVLYTLDDAISALDISTGKVLWTIDQPGIRASDYSNGVLYYGRSLYISNSNSSRRNIVEALDVNDRHIIWSKDLGSFGGVPNIVVSDNLLLISTKTDLYALDQMNGELRWRAKISYGQKPTIYDGEVYILEGFSNKLIAIRFETGEKLGYLQTTLPVILFIEQNNLIVSDNLLIIGVGNKVYAYNR